MANPSDRFSIHVINHIGIKKGQKEVTHLIQKVKIPKKNSEPPNFGFFQDPRDSQEYKFVVLKDSNKWMAQNLNYETEGSVCYYYDSKKCEKFERLYPFKEVLNYTREEYPCPPGWRIPTKDQWMKLFSLYNKGNDKAYLSLIKEKNGSFLKQGGYYDGTKFEHLHIEALYWTGTSHGLEDAHFVSISDIESKMFNPDDTYGSRGAKCYCRCIEQKGL